MIASPPPNPGFFGLRPGLPDALPGRGGRSWRVAAGPAGRGAELLKAKDGAAPTGAAKTAGSLEQKLVQRISFGVTLAEMQRIGRLGYQRYLAEQLDPEAIDDHELEAALAANLRTLAMTAAEIFFAYPVETFTPAYELQVARIYRAAYSKRQLLEMTVELWTDHFNIDLYSDTGYFLKPVDDREVVRRHALGTFPDLLRASAHSPAMLAYLSNDTNVKGHPNENYARELMELHTLGADRGYTQQDVREVARCFTGWTFSYDEDKTLGTFRFDPDAHDDDAKLVLGTTIPAGGGIGDGETVIHLLALHPNTAKLVAKKLLRHFWGYEPSQAYIDEVAKVYQDTGGDIPSMLRTVLKPAWIAAAPPKLKRPLHVLASALRALFAGASSPAYLFDQLQQAGHLPYVWSPPNGYPDARGYWSGFLLPRWNFAATLLDEATSAVSINLSYLDPRLAPAILVGLINAVVANGALTTATQAALRSFLRVIPRTPERIREAVGLALASPEFQDY